MAGKTKTPRDVRFSRKSREWLLNARRLSRRHRAGLLSGKAIDSRLRNSRKKIDVKTIKTRSSHFYESNFMFCVRFIQQVLHSLRDSDAMIRKARSFPTLSSVNGSIRWPNRLWLSWSQPAPIAERNVPIEPLLFHFLRTSFIVHALLKCFERSSFKKTRCFRARSKKSKRKRSSFCLGQPCYLRFLSSYCWEGHRR